ncbi:hypothetical protein F5Y10DRAFT_287467 [Nemania abortiva]|nr:hypothetical protein F5Y10DRAFT_287467 [Nemania abortiva]
MRPNTMRSSYSVQKSWNGRRKGAIKKVHELFQIFGAKVSIIIEKDGELFSYQSHLDLSTISHGSVKAANKMTPNDFTTVAEKLRQDSPSLLRQETSQPLSQHGSTSGKSSTTSPSHLEPSSTLINPPPQRPRAHAYFNILKD